MTTRYFTEAGDDWYAPLPQTMTVICSDDELPVDTGLVDANGVRLFRRVEREPIGFRIRKPVVRVKAGSAPVGR